MPLYAQYREKSSQCKRSEVGSSVCWKEPSSAVGISHTCSPPQVNAKNYLKFFCLLSFACGQEKPPLLLHTGSAGVTLCPGTNLGNPVQAPTLGRRAGSSGCSCTQPDSAAAYVHLQPAALCSHWRFKIPPKSPVLPEDWCILTFFQQYFHCHQNCMYLKMWLLRLSSRGTYVCTSDPEATFLLLSKQQIPSTAPFSMNTKQYFEFHKALGILP